jgi:hypothetical protein
MADMIAPTGADGSLLPARASHDAAAPWLCTMQIDELDRDAQDKLLTTLNHLKRFLVSHGAEAWGSRVRQFGPQNGPI